MDKYSIDTDTLDRLLNAPKMYKLADVQDQIRKVAFDVVTFRNDPETLWQIVKGEDGDYIVATYDSASELISNSSAAAAKSKTASANIAWAVETDRLQKTATIFYKNTPITNINLVAAKIEDPEDFKYRIPQMLNKNASLVRKMISGLEESYRRQILNKFPELQ